MQLARVDVLVSNAGANVFHRPLMMPRSQSARCMALDLEAVWSMADAVLPRRPREGRTMSVTRSGTKNLRAGKTRAQAG